MATASSSGTSAIFPGRSLGQLITYTYHTSAGRDKLFRAVRNLAGFLEWVLQRSHTKNQRWSRLIVSLTLIRKHLGLNAKLARGSMIFGLFRFAANAATKSQGLDTVQQHLLVGKLLSFGVFSTLDLLCFFDAVDVMILPNAAAVQRKAIEASLCGVIFSTTSALYSLVRTHKRQLAPVSSSNNQADGGPLEEHWPEVLTKLIVDLCDLVVVTSALGYSNFNGGVIGLLGTVGSMISLCSL